VDDATLVAACRPNVAADAGLLAAMGRGATAEYADTGPLDGQADFLARTYARRAKHLSDKGLLRSDLAQTLSDLELLRSLETTARVVIRIESEGDGRTVYTALVVGQPPRVRACFVHHLPEE
jgi:hypothetical protein